MTTIWKMTNHTYHFSVSVRHTVDVMDRYAVLFSNTPTASMLVESSTYREYAVQYASDYYEACVNALQGGN